MNQSTSLLWKLAGGAALVCGLTLPGAAWAQGLNVGGEGGPSVSIDRESGINASAGEGGPSAHVGSDGVSASAGGEGGASASVGEGGVSANAGGEGGGSADVGNDHITADAGEGGGSVEISEDGINVIPPLPPEEPDGEEPNGEEPNGEGEQP